MHTLVAGNRLLAGVIGMALSGRGIYPGARALPEPSASIPGLCFRFPTYLFMSRPCTITGVGR